MTGFERASVRHAYDAVAERYAATYADELTQLPLDLAVLDDAAPRLAGRGTVLDVGCGPGQVGAHLMARGVSVVGADLSPGMLAVAHRRSPAMPLLATDVCALALMRGACAGAVAYYSLQHLPRTDLPRALAELRRVIADGGLFVVAAHLGDGDVHTDEFLGAAVDISAALYGRDEFVDAIGAAGFAVEDIRTRGPAAGEAETQRIYVTSAATAVA